MIAAFAVMVAVVANAAATQWNVTALKIIGVDNVAASTYTSGSKAIIMVSLAGENNWVEVAQLSVSSGKISAGNPSFETTKLSAGNNYDFYFVITDTNSAGKDVIFTSTIVANVAAQQSSAATIGFGNQTTAGQTWESVPEPTSGLLLLLGVAGLALRRKQK